jgi:KipI family sensor histidine kinase inhibitor
MRVRRFGRDSLLIEVSREQVTRLEEMITTTMAAVELELVPAEASLLIRFNRDIGDAPSLIERVTAITSAVTSTPAVPSDFDARGRIVDVPVIYDGEDLAECADALGMSRAALIEAHTATEYRVGFCGFAPGFAYLLGLDEALRRPRRETPRTRVPPGSVAIAGHYSAVYPRASPGGWHLIGRTDRVPFDPQREEPVLLPPGTVVRFTPVRELIDSATPQTAGLGPPTTSPSESAAAIEVVSPGPLSLIEDLGRPGWARSAVTPSGAWDRASHALAQRLVGNPEDAAGLECLGAGLHLRALAPTTLAITGAPGDAWRHRHGERTPVATHASVFMAAGDELILGPLRSGLRRYVAVRGGLDIAPVLGSRSRDTLAELGPGPLETRMRLSVGPATGDVPAVDATIPSSVRSRVMFLPGPDWDLLTEESRRLLQSGALAVSTASDRVGVRLDGVRLESRGSADSTQASRPMVRGAIQLPPDGHPVVLGPDHPTTGGYPVIGVLFDPDAPAQWSPGVTVHLIPDEC